MVNKEEKQKSFPITYLELAARGIPLQGFIVDLECSLFHEIVKVC